MLFRISTYFYVAHENEVTRKSSQYEYRVTRYDRISLSILS